MGLIEIGVVVYLVVLGAIAFKNSKKIAQVLRNN